MKQHLIYFLFFLILGAVAIQVLRAPFYERGDGREYIIQTQSIVFDHSLRIDTKSRRDYWNLTNPFGLTLSEAKPPLPKDGHQLKETDQACGNFGSLYPDENGDYRYIHSWMYSLATSSLYALLHYIDSGRRLEYYSFRLFNLLLFILSLSLLLIGNPSFKALLTLTLTLASPLTGYLEWEHVEVFCFALTLIAFILIDSPRLRYYSTIPLGIAAAQNIPILLFLPIHTFLYSKKLGKDWPSPSHWLKYLLGLIFPALQLFYFREYFGVFSLYPVLKGASLDFITFDKVLDIFISPLMGCLWFYPLLFLLLPSRIAKANALQLFFICLSVLLVASLASSTSNLSSSQIGSLRYAAWFTAPLLWAILKKEWQPNSIIQKCLETFGFISSLFIIIYFQSYRLLLGDSMYFMSHDIKRYEISSLYKLTHYHDDAELLAEHIQGKEIYAPYNFNGFYIWKLDQENSMWLLSKRALDRLSHLEFLREPNSEIASSLNSDILSCSEYLCRLNPENINYFHKHPVLGHYQLIWIKGPLKEIKANVPIYLREET
ncbi:MAG: hypothetical protein GYA55_11810 [SAR324 cluster bacterium]|uniref:Glycosyltransferase RgtA/B/C/D-like domain-containing protein n=1 Tax=SAR324 cluster bacterium TaxID=2024889 RepID=A0A7X9IL72_9DELT|nr:hypothetical protein [SAR324 cluster bacterium]